MKIRKPSFNYFGFQNPFPCISKYQVGVLKIYKNFCNKSVYLQFFLGYSMTKFI